MRRIHRLLAVGAMTAGVIVATPLVASAAPSVTVSPGQSIQAAIDSAAPGTTINVKPGTYHENLFIQKNGIKLAGKDATLEPPNNPANNLCVDNSGPSPSFPGVCVVGQFDNSFNLIDTTRNVTISGFTIEQFPAEGIFAFGVKSFTVLNNTLRKNGGYGVFSLQSISVTYTSNHASHNGDAGFYVGESPEANVSITNNSSESNLGEGILFRDSRGGVISNNTFEENCIGALLLDTGIPVAGGKVTLSNNTIRDNNNFCPAGDDAPAHGGMGVGVGGVDHVTVKNNTITFNVEQSGSDLPGGGIVLLDTSGFGGRPPNNNNILSNKLHDNAPLDILDDGSGSGNVYSGNVCNSSNNGACGV